MYQKLTKPIPLFKTGIKKPLLIIKFSSDRFYGQYHAGKCSRP